MRLNFSRQLTILVFSLTAFVFIVGLVSGRELLEIFTTSVALAVSSIPEGLLVGLTVVLAIGMQRILKRKGLVRNLVSAETLGGVTTICIDKTGTLTEGRLRVVDVIGNNDELIKQSLIANDLDDPIVIAAYEWASKTAENHRFRAENYERLDTIPFSSKDRFFATLARWDEAHNMIFVNGAPEFLARWSNLEGRKLVEINRKIEELSMQGKRVIGFARRKVKTSKVRLRGDDIKDDLEWVGMMAFSDPVRKGVKTALFKAKQAGIKLVVITGDYAQTAISVMHQLGITIKSSEIILGEEVEKLSIPMLTSRLAKDSEVKLFARTTPEQKLNIVKALKLGGEAVAMTGDGVNDAPALKRADIGVVVGDATDVARESADLVLLDSRFETILAAVEEGRGIFDNVRKIILYLMSDAFQGIIVIVGAMILGLPLPVTAAQILWINLISDGFPDLALTVDPINPGVMKKPPRASSEPIVSSWMRSLIVIVSISGGLLALAVFAIIYNASSQNLALSQSVAFAVLGINSLVYVFSIRTLKQPFWKSDLFGNRWLVLAVVAGLVLQLSPFVVSPVGEPLGDVPIGGYWICVGLSAILIFVLIEQSKLLFKGVLGGKRGK